MTLKKSQIAKALSVAIIGSSVALMGCEKADTPSNSTVVEMPQKQTSLIRTKVNRLKPFMQKCARSKLAMLATN